MAWRYRGPKGRFVSQSRYKRYKHLPSYKRISDKNWKTKKRKTLGERVKRARQSLSEFADFPELWEAYEAYDPDFYDGEYEDQGEIESGVDYGEE
jgi:hypothetical protein